MLQELIVWLINWKLYFLEWKTPYFVQKFSPRECLKLQSRALNFQNFPRHSLRHSSPLIKGNYWPLVDTVGYSFQTCWLLQCLKPLKKGRMGNHKHKILNRPFKPWRFSFASIFATDCSLGSSAQSDCLAHLQWKPLENPGPLMSLQQNSCSY